MAGTTAADLSTAGAGHPALDGLAVQIGSCSRSPGVRTASAGRDDFLGAVWR